MPNKQEWDSSSNLPVFLWSRCVTRICSRILTAKDVPKAFQDNPRIDTSRMLLDYKSASTTERLQSVSSSQEGQTRCPLTGGYSVPCRCKTWICCRLMIPCCSTALAFRTPSTSAWASGRATEVVAFKQLVRATKWPFSLYQ